MIKKFVWAIICLVLLSAGATPFVGAAGPTNTTFVVVSSTWGTTANPVEVGPGSQNVLLTLSVEYTGGVQATGIQAVLRLPAGITDVYGNTAPAASTTGINPYTIFPLTYNLNIASNVALGTYNIPIQFSWTTTAGGSFSSSSEVDSFPVNILGSATLTYQPSLTSLNTGQVNNIKFTLTNTGTGAATQISTSVSGSLVSVLNVQPTIATLAPGASVPLNVSLFVPTSAAGSSIPLTFTASYTDSYGFSKTTSETLGLYAISVPVPTLQFQTSQTSLVPGTTNKVGITLTNLGPGSVSRVFTTVSTSAPFSIMNQFPVVASLGANSNTSVDLSVYVPITAAGSSLTLSFSATYIDSSGNARSVSQTIGLSVTSLATIVSNTALSVTSGDNSLTAGESSPVSFVIKNTGTLPVSSPTVGLSVSTPLVVSGNSTYSFPGLLLNPGETITLQAAIVSGLGTPGGFYSGTLTIVYLDQSQTTRNQTVPVGFVLLQPVTQLSVKALATNIAVGQTSAVSFLISNAGTAPVYSPTFSLSVPSPLAVTLNATYSTSGLTLNPGQSIKFESEISSGPKISEGAYASTLTVTYTDRFGNTHTSSFPVGVVAIGTIQLVIQDQQIAQTANGVDVSGTLLNEGSASAFYARVIVNLTGSANLGSASTYVGEVDPNTPLPFSLTVTPPPLDAEKNATLTLSTSYQNDFGQVLNSALGTSQVHLLSSNQIAQQASSQSTRGAVGQTGLGGATSLVAIVGIVALAIVVLALFVRRRRRGGSKRSTGGTSEAGSGKKVY